MNDKRLPSRFWAKVDVDAAGCWSWSAYCHPDGYGRYKLDGKGHYAHRVSYEALVGPIPDGLDLDHLCRQRSCVNPTHLEPVTRRENTRRGEGYTAQQSAKTHCNSGHPFDDANTYRYRGNRICRACNVEAARRARNKKRGVLL